MSVKLLTEYHLEFLSLKEAAQAHLSLHLSKYDIVGNHIYSLYCITSGSIIMSCIINDNTPVY